MSTRIPVIRKGMFCGDLDVATQDLILNTREAKCVPSLKHMVYDFPPELVLEALDNGMSTLDYLKEKGIDKSQYVGELRDYQTVGTAFMYYSPHSMIGDGVGLGKTAEISALINILKLKGEMRRFLIAVENSAIGQTWMEIMRFTGLMVVLLPSTKDELMKVANNTDWRKVDGIIITHSTLNSSTFSTWLSYNLFDGGNRCRLYDTFILDESSVIKNNKTKMYTYVANLCRLAQRVHFMNATVFETNIMDIYYQIDMMDPSLLPAKTNIEKKYSIYARGKAYWRKNTEGKAEQKYRWERIGYKNQEEFKNSLKLCYLARSKQTPGILEELGQAADNNDYIVREVDPTTDQMLAIKSGFRYNEVLNSPNNVPDAGIGFNRKENPKLNELCNIIQNQLEGQLVMVYCFHISAQEQIKEELEKIGRKPIILNGRDTSAQKVQNRLKITESFNKGTHDVIITNIMKSLNLYNGDACILYSVVGNPSKQTQILGRIDRNIDNKKKTFILLLYRHTAEEELYKNVVSQREKDSRSLTIDAKGAVSRFMEVIEQNESSSQ